MGNIIDGLKKAKLYDLVNIILVSDHGMVQTGPSKNILIGNFVDINALDMNKSVIYGVNANIFVKPGRVSRVNFK